MLMNSNENFSVMLLCRYDHKISSSNIDRGLAIEHVANKKQKLEQKQAIKQEIEQKNRSR
jgi:hypothetical protein